MIKWLGVSLQLVVKLDLFICWKMWAVGVAARPSSRIDELVLAGRRLPASTFEMVPDSQTGVHSTWYFHQLGISLSLVIKL